MKQFNTLTKVDVEKLRRKPIAVAYAGRGVTYAFTETDVEDAKKHLENLYTGIVTYAFTAKILLLNQIYHGNVNEEKENNDDRLYQK